jgi:hypothetical protein
MPSEPKNPSSTPPREGGNARPGNAREERLAQALRDNLRKRKVQQRERNEGQRGRKDGQGGGAEPCAPAGTGDDPTR